MQPVNYEIIMRKALFIFLAISLLSSCGEFEKVRKSNDYDLKYEYAQRAFENKKYMECATLLEELVTIYKGSERAEDALYMLARSYYLNEDYLTAGEYFKAYYRNFPKGKYAELSRYYCGYGYYLDSPDPRLDQSGTYKAIEEMQQFIDYFPKSDKAPEAQEIIFELQDKLVYKELLNAQLYYNLGNYMGNNYQSAVITAQNALKEYPYTRYKETLMMLILKSKYQEAMQSYDEKKPERFRGVLDEYYSFINEFPDGPNTKEAQNIFKVASRYVKE